MRFPIVPEPAKDGEVSAGYFQSQGIGSVFHMISAGFQFQFAPVDAGIDTTAVVQQHPGIESEAVESNGAGSKGVGKRVNGTTKLSAQTAAGIDGGHAAHLALLYREFAVAQGDLRLLDAKGVL